MGADREERLPSGVPTSISGHHARKLSVPVQTVLLDRVC